MTQIDLNRYKEFVQAVTSTESDDTGAMIARLQYLENDSGVSMALLITAAIGLASEGGEFDEIVKKCVFQGKPLDEDTVFHLKRELGDVLFYWISACRSLGLDPNDVIQENMHKLESRYPGGKFDAYYSENRKAGDL